ncbi:DUF4214 domain-containing protein [Belnapia moabensis]|uniref:DUF4214 domain-containing protein n=1 Tax=Belnapia moabensis TaxID=365533 RepID=UPI00146FDEC7|nr:DUF4214 domain-containing protein [Belnapia moabensis]
MNDDFLGSNSNNGTTFQTYGPAGQIIRLYDTMLDRFPEPAGRDYYVNLINTGQATLQSLEANFQNSPEFLAKYGNTSNAQFIELLYQNTLNRGPEGGVVDYYVNRLQAARSCKTSRKLLNISLASSKRTISTLSNLIIRRRARRRTQQYLC